MGEFLLKTCPLIFLLACTNAAGVGKAWRVLPYSKLDYWNHPTWPRLDSSAFEVRTVSGVGRLVAFDDAENGHRNEKLDAANSDETITFQDPKEHLTNDEKSESSLLDHFMRSVVKDPPHVLNNEHNTEDDSSLDNHERDSIKDSFYNQKKQNTNDVEGFGTFQKVFRTGVMMKVVQPTNRETTIREVSHNPIKVAARVRRETQNETKMEHIATTKNVRDVRMSSPDTWSAQPISVEFRHRASLDQMIQQAEEEEDPSTKLRSYHAPHTDFVTSQHRRSYPESRESREMPATRTYDDYDFPWYRNMIRERDYDLPSYRRAYSYHYPTDRYRTERDYYMRVPSEPSYYYDRYRDDDFDLYGRSRPTPKPKRIVYYATLPEVVRKPVDLRNYPRPYDGLMRTPVSRDGSYKRIPGNVDPSRYRYRQLYDGYDSYSKRSSYFDRPYSYSDAEDRRKGSVKENIRNNDGFEPNSERKMSNQISVRDDGKLPWPVQIGTEVSVKDDERIPGRKVFGESSGFERFHSAQLQKAPDATGSSELQSDN